MLIFEDEKECELCGAGFTLTRRRHHCRICGRAACGQCSDNFVMSSSASDSSPVLRPQSPNAVSFFEKVRACNDCIDERKQSITNELSEELEAQQKIVESLRIALKESSMHVEKFDRFIREDIFPGFSRFFQWDEDELKRIKSLSFFDLCNLCDANFARLNEIFISAKKDYQEEISRKLGKERNLDLLRERSKKSQNTLQRVKLLDERKAELKAKVDCQALVIDSLRDRIFFLERPRHERNISTTLDEQPGINLIMRRLGGLCQCPTIYGDERNEF